LKIFHNCESCSIKCGDGLLCRSRGSGRLCIALLLAVAEGVCRVIAQLIVFVAQVKASNQYERDKSM
jgi:hypothetical protein